MSKAAPDWSSLPSELVGQVADALLATHDVDYYASLRAVCHGWRDATVDPRSSPSKCFLPRRWFVLKSADVWDSRHLFLNVDTGRFVWKDRPVLRGPFMATDDDGLLIMHRPSSSREIYALNPLTGATIRFPLRMLHPPEADGQRGRVVVAGSSPEVAQYWFRDQDQGALVNLNSEILIQDIFGAKPPLESFASVVPFQGRVYAMDVKGTVVLLEARGEMTTVVAGDWQEASRPTFLVDNAGDLLAVRAPTLQEDIVQVFRVDLQKKVLRMIKSVGNRAIFLGTRSLSVDTHNLPAIEANCIYYNGSSYQPQQHGIYVHRLDDGSHEKLDECLTVGPLSLQHVLLDSVMRVW